MKLLMLLVLAGILANLGFGNADENSGAYIPCKTFISFSYDDSNTLSADQFKTQMAFIKAAIGNLNYPVRLRAEGEYGSEFNWNSRLSISQMQTAVSSAEQTQIPFSLLQQLSSLVTSFENLDSPTDPIGALIFISDTSDDALRNADRLIPKLAGVKLTFMLMGTNVQVSKLRNFTTNFIYWQDLDQPEPDNWDLLFSRAYACDLPSVVTTTTVTPYIPCHSWIFFGVDDSTHLEYSFFKKQISFISSEIGGMNHPERLAVGSVYTDYTAWSIWNTIAEIQTDLRRITQPGLYFLHQIFADLSTNAIDNSPTDYPMAAVIFISDTSDAAISGADPYMQWLKDVQITFVLLGATADPSKLTKYSSNFIYWDSAQAQPTNWTSLAGHAYGC